MSSSQKSLAQLEKKASPFKTLACVRSKKYTLDARATIDREVHHYFLRFPRFGGLRPLPKTDLEKKKVCYHRGIPFFGYFVS